MDHVLLKENTSVSSNSGEMYLDGVNIQNYFNFV